MILLGIETSCDETAAAIVNSNRHILVNRVITQKEHIAYKGVVPEIGARCHIALLDGLIEEVMDSAGITYQNLTGVAATAGPGLIGGIMVGLVMAKAISAAANIPLIAIHHLEGHILTIRLTEGLSFPFLIGLMSGGHTCIAMVEGVGQYTVLGRSLDDAVGECFDKAAKMMGLGFPGGPFIEQCAKTGDPNRFVLPKPLFYQKGYDFSFSGLKTVVKHCIAQLPSPLSFEDQADLSASLQSTVAIILGQRLTRAMHYHKQQHKPPYRLVIAGGVAANVYIREYLTQCASAEGFSFHAPPINLCTDNAAMIAWAGIERLQLNTHASELTIAPRARWPLEAL